MYKFIKLVWVAFLKSAVRTNGLYDLLTMLLVITPLVIHSETHCNLYFSFSFNMLLKCHHKLQRTENIMEEIHGNSLVKRAGHCKLLKCLK